MLRPFETEIGHFALDYSWSRAQTALRDTTIGNILQQATIQVGQLAKSDHLEFWDSIGNHAQGMDEAESIRVKVGLECCLVHQETNGIVGDQQAV